MPRRITVEQAIAILQDMPKKAVLVIAGEAISGIQTQEGRLREGYFNDTFKVVPDGRDTAVVFTTVDELSTGDVIDRVI